MRYRPAPVSLFQPACAPVALQCHAEVIGSYLHAELARKVLADLLRGGLISERFERAQASVAQWHCRLCRLLAAAASGPSTPGWHGWRRGRCSGLSAPTAT